MASVDADPTPQAPPSSPPRPSPRDAQPHIALLRACPGLRRLVAANILSLAGSQIGRIALVLFVFGEHLSVPMLAMLVLLETLPGALGAPFAGVLIDRVSKRGAMIAADLVRAGAMAVVLLHPTFATICAMAALHSLVTMVFQPAKEAAIPIIVPGDRLLYANSLDQSSSNLVLVVAPVVGGLVFQLWGLGVALLVDVASFLLSAALIARIRMPPSAAPDGQRMSLAAGLADLAAGLRYLRAHALAGRLIAIFFLGLVCTGVWLPLAPFFMVERIGAQAHAIGWQLGLLGLGAVVGGLLAPALAQRVGRGTCLWLGLVCEAVLQGTYALTTDLWASHALVFVWGAATAVIVVPFYSLLQGTVDRVFQGRVFTLVRLAEYLALATAMGLVLLVHAEVSPALVILAGGLLYLAAALGFALLPGGARMLRHA